MKKYILLLLILFCLTITGCKPKTVKETIYSLDEASEKLGVKIELYESYTSGRWIVTSDAQEFLDDKGTEVKFNGFYLVAYGDIIKYIEIDVYYIEWGFGTVTCRVGWNNPQGTFIAKESQKMYLEKGRCRCIYPFESFSKQYDNYVIQLLYAIKAK